MMTSLVETTTRPVVLVSLDWGRPDDRRRNLGAASIVATLTEAGATVTWVEDAVNAPEFNLEHFINRVRDAVMDAGPSVLVGIGCYVGIAAD